jgi:hypothetical protein
MYLLNSFIQMPLPALELFLVRAPCLLTLPHYPPWICAPCFFHAHTTPTHPVHLGFAPLGSSLTHHADSLTHSHLHTHALTHSHLHTHSLTHSLFPSFTFSRSTQQKAESWLAAHSDDTEQKSVVELMMANAWVQFGRTQEAEQLLTRLAAQVLFLVCSPFACLQQPHSFSPPPTCHSRSHARLT